MFTPSLSNFVEWIPVDGLFIVSVIKPGLYRPSNWVVFCITRDWYIWLVPSPLHNHLFWLFRGLKYPDCKMRSLGVTYFVCLFLWCLKSFTLLYLFLFHHPFSLGTTGLGTSYSTSSVRFPSSLLCKNLFPLSYILPDLCSFSNVQVPHPTFRHTPSLLPMLHSSLLSSPRVTRINIFQHEK